jgi:hypothetical protein
MSNPRLLLDMSRIELACGGFPVLFIATWEKVVIEKKAKPAKKERNLNVLMISSI